MGVSTAVTGIGESPYFRAGKSPHSVRQLASMAVHAAIEDAGLTPADVDGIVTYHDNEHDSARLWSWLGLGNLTFSAKAWGGGGNGGGSAVQLADAAVQAGYAKNVLVYRALHQGHEGRYGRYNVKGPYSPTGTAATDEAFMVPFGGAAPVIKNALLIKRFMHLYGVSQEALCEISLACYDHAQSNPRAVMYGKPLTREEYHASRWIAEPLHLYDCCQETDGACAIIVSRAEEAVDRPQRPVYIAATANGMDHDGGLGSFNDSAYPNGRLRSVGRQLWAKAGVSPEDVDVAQMYENFTGSTLMAISDIGFCEPGDVEAFVSDGNLHRGGRLPFNTSGGNIAEGYIHGFQLMVEAVRQVRGTSTYQIDDVELSLFVAGPGTAPSSAALLSASR
ncbi:MAG: Acetyl-CoA acetyltransferase [Actinomycetia bacterium]|nr:Acetyl-CoA acetyltransferase [Actinomycetes bacterium]